MELVKRETCQQYVARRLSEGWQIISRSGFNIFLQSPDGMLRPVDLRNDVETLRPNAAGDECNITAETGEACPNHYQNVDEDPANDDTDYNVTSNITYVRDFYNIDDSGVGAGTINHITVYARCRTNYDPTQASLKICIKGDSTATEDAEKTITTDWTNYSKQWATNPADSEAWAWTDIDALQIGVSIRRPVAATFRYTYCTQMYVEVDYTAVTVHELVVSDGIEIGDALVKMPIKTLSDGIQFSDVVTKAFYKTLSDAFAFTDALIGYKLLVKTLVDGIALADALVKSTSKVISDGVQFTDTLIKSTTKVISDGLAIADTLVKSMARVFTDGIAFTDIVHRLYEKVFTDGIKFRDILYKWRWLTPTRVLPLTRLLQPKRWLKPK